MAGEYVAEQMRLHMLIAQRLELLTGRRVPVRRVSPGPSEGVTRLQWGDGTVLLARSVRPGSMGQIWSAIRRAKSVTVDSWVFDPDTVTVTLVVPGSRAGHVDVVVLGLDQPD